MIGGTCAFVDVCYLVHTTLESFLSDSQAWQSMEDVASSIKWRLASTNQGEIVSTNDLMLEDLMKIYEDIA